MLTTALQGEYYYSCFTNEKVGAQRGVVRSQASKWWRSESQEKQPGLTEDPWTHEQVPGL